MNTLVWIIGSSLAMSAIAWVGLVTLAFNEEQLKKLLLPLVAFAAGSLLGGALLHLLPEAVAARGATIGTFLPAQGLPLKGERHATLASSTLDASMRPA